MNAKFTRKLSLIAVSIALGITLVLGAMAILSGPVQATPPLVHTIADCDPWNSSDHDYCIPFYFQEDYGTVSNFRVMVRLDDEDDANSCDGFAPQGCQDVDYDHFPTDGVGILFMTDAGVTVSHHIAEWDSSGLSTIWISVSATSDYIHLYYDDGVATNHEDVAGTWGSTYQGVWLLTEDNDMYTNFADGAATIATQYDTGDSLDLADFWNDSSSPFTTTFTCYSDTTFSSVGNVTYTHTGPFTFQPDDGALWYVVTPPQWYRMDFEKDDEDAWWGPGGDQDLAFYVSDWVYDDVSGTGQCVRYSMGYFTDDYTNTLDVDNPSDTITGTRYWVLPDWGVQYAGHYPNIQSPRYPTVPAAETKHYEYYQYRVSAAGAGLDFLDTPWTHGWTVQGSAAYSDTTTLWRMWLNWDGPLCYGSTCGNVATLHLMGGDEQLWWYMMEDEGLIQSTRANGASPSYNQHCLPTGSSIAKNFYTTDATDSPVGGGRVFNGSTGYIAAPDTADFTNGTDQICVEALVKFDSLGSVEEIVNKAESDVTGWSLAKDTNDKIKWTVSDGSGGWAEAWSLDAVEANTWYYVVGQIYGKGTGAGWTSITVDAAPAQAPYPIHWVDTDWGTNPVYIGALSWNGAASYHLEGTIGGYVSIRDDVPSEAYIKSSWKNFVAKSFVQYGREDQYEAVECWSCKCANQWVTNPNDGITRTLDVDKNGVISIVDIMLVQTKWALSSGDAGWEECYDMDGNDTINATDLTLVASQWDESGANCTDVCDTGAETTGDGVLAASTWYVDDVDTAGNPGHNGLEMVVDSDGLAHIAYHDYSSPPDGKLRYAYQTYDGFAGTNWNLETITDAHASGWRVDMALDSSDYPHLVYIYDEGQGTTTGERDGTEIAVLRYAYQDADGWHFTDIRTDDWDSTYGARLAGSHPAISLDSSDYPHISSARVVTYASGDTYPDFTWSIIHDYQDVSGWHSATLQTTAQASFPGSWCTMDTDIAVDGADNVRAVWGDSCAWVLRHGYYTGTTWTTGTIGFATPPYDRPQIAIDSQDYPHVAVQTNHGGDLGLRYAYLDATGWHTKTVDSGGTNSCSIVMDTDDYPHIAYTDFSHTELYYGYKDATGWHTSTVPHNADGEWGTSIFLDGLGLPHIVGQYSTDDILRYYYKR